MAKSVEPNEKTASLRVSAPLREKKEGSHRGAEAPRGELGVELPEGWAVAPLGKVVSPSKQKVEPSERPDVVYLSLEHIESDTGRIIGHGVGDDVRSTKAAFHAGDVLYGKLRPYLNKVCIPDFDGICSTDILVFPQTDDLEPRYLLRFLMQRSVVEYAHHNSAGVQLPRVSFEKLAELAFPLPPLAEQRRITAAVEALLSRVRAVRARLAKVPALLKRFRQSVLAAACCGELTEDWREGNPCEEPGDALLARIKSERMLHVQSTKDRQQIEWAFTQSSQGIDDEEFGFEDIPECWSRCRIGAAATVCNGSTPSRTRREFWDGAIPWVSSGEVRNNVISTTRERISDLGFESTSVRLLPRGTVLLAMIGEGKTRGQSAILNIESTINQNIAAAIISHGLIVPEFLWRWFQMRYEATREQGGGSGPQALNCQRVRELPFLLPPLEEQHEIVRRVEALFALADKIEARVAAATVRVEKIAQAILAKAFRGELVPTEAELARAEGRDYEPASVLLERIRAERDAAGTGGTMKPRRVSRRKSPIKD